MSNLSAWNPQLWPEVIDKWEVDNNKAWHNHNQTEDMLSYLEIFLGKTTLNLHIAYKRNFSNEIEK